MSRTATRGASATSTNTTTADEMKVVHTFVKNSFEEVWTYLQPYKGTPCAHVRVFATGDDEAMYPTRKGITVKLSDVPKLAEAVTALAMAVKEQKP
jgi:Transcriptional Coactivator p15 (PC4)